jgi:hypothetical protein
VVIGYHYNTATLDVVIGYRFGRRLSQEIDCDSIFPESLEACHIMEPALEMIDRSLQGDDGARASIERTMSIGQIQDVRGRGTLSIKP